MTLNQVRYHYQQEDDRSQRSMLFVPLSDLISVQ